MLTPAVCDEILDLLDQVRQLAPSPQAKEYARAASEAFAMYGEKGLRTQVTYVLCNVQNWRDEDARRIKAALKAAVK